MLTTSQPCCRYEMSLHQLDQKRPERRPKQRKKTKAMVEIDVQYEIVKAQLRTRCFRTARSSSLTRRIDRSKSCWETSMISCFSSSVRSVSASARRDLKAALISSPSCMPVKERKEKPGSAITEDALSAPNGEMFACGIQNSGPACTSCWRIQRPVKHQYFQLRHGGCVISPPEKTAM